MCLAGSSCALTTATQLSWILQVTLGAIGTLALTHLWGARSKRKPRRSPPPSTAQSDSAVVEVPDRIRRAETVLRRRSSQVLLVLEASIDENNHQVTTRAPSSCRQ